MTSEQISPQEIKQTVLTPRGEIPLEKIQIGDEVIGFNYDTKEKETYVVTQKGPFSRDRKYIDDEGVYHYEHHKNKVFYEVNSEFYFAPHQSLYANGNVIHAFELQLGDLIENANGEKFRVETLQQVKSASQKILLSIERKRSKLQKVLGLNKSQHHTYFINGILVHNASRFWVGGSQTWDGTAGTKWSATDGGSSGASVPTAADDVFFTASSSGTITTSGTTTDVCRSLNCTGFTGTLSHAAGTIITIGDATAGASNIALKLVAGMTYTLGNATTSEIDFISTSATVQTVDFASKNTGQVNFNAASNGSWQLSGTWGTSSVSTSALTTLTKGTLDLNGQTIFWGTFSSSNSNTRTLTMGAASITIAATGTSWNCGTSTNWTFNANTSSITVNNGGSTVTFQGGSKTYNNVSFTGAAAFKVIGGANIFNNFTCTGTAVQTCGLQFQAAQTINGTFTASGNSITNRLLINSSTNGTSRTITTAAVSLTNVDIRDITAAGAAGTWTGTSLGNAGGNTNITFDTPVTLYWVGNGGNWSSTTHWSTSSGGASGASVPLCHDTVIFDSNSITSSSQTITVDEARFPGCNFTNVLNNPTFTNNVSTGVGQEIYGSLIMKSGMTMSGTTQLAMIAYGVALSITSNGVGFTQPFVPAAMGGGGSITFTDAFSDTNTVTFNSGTITCNSSITTGSLNHTAGTATFNGNVTCNNFSSNSSITRVVNMGSGTWKLTGTGIIWNTSTIAGLTVNGLSATVLVTDTSAASKTFANRNTGTIGTLTFSGGGGAIILFNANGTYTNLNLGANATYRLTTTGTTTIKNLTGNGSLGNLVTIDSDTPGTKASLTCSLSGVISVDYFSIQDSNATGTATFYAGTHSTNVSNNSGWIFTAGASSTTLTDSVTPTETLKRDTGKFLTTTLSLTETLKRDTMRILTDTVDPLISLPQSLSLNGTLNRAVVSLSNTTIYGGSALTFLFSMRPSANPIGGVIFHWGTNTTVRLQLLFGGGNNMLVVSPLLYNGGTWPTSATVFLPNVTYRIGVVINNNDVKIYVNGVLDADINFSGTYSYADSLPFYLGYSPESGGNQFFPGGLIDEFVAFNTIKDSSFILSDYNSGNPLAYSPAADIIGLYHFDGSLNDSSSNNIGLTSIDATYANTLVSGGGETLTKFISTIKSDSVTLTETLLRQTGKIFTDSVSFTESLLKSVNKFITESLSLSETITKITNYFKTISESITLTETLTKQTGKFFTDSVSLTESLIKSVTKSFTESVSFVESILSIKNPYNYRAIKVAYTFTKVKVTSIINRIKVRVDL